MPRSKKMDHSTNFRRIGDIIYEYGENWEKEQDDCEGWQWYDCDGWSFAYQRDIYTVFGTIRGLRIAYRDDDKKNLWERYKDIASVGYIDKGTKRTYHTDIWNEDELLNLKLSLD